MTLLLLDHAGLMVYLCAGVCSAAAAAAGDVDIDVLCIALKASCCLKNTDKLLAVVLEPFSSGWGGQCD